MCNTIYVPYTHVDRFNVNVGGAALLTSRVSCPILSSISPGHGLFRWSAIIPGSRRDVETRYISRQSRGTIVWTEIA